MLEGAGEGPGRGDWLWIAFLVRAGAKRSSRAVRRFRAGPPTKPPTRDRVGGRQPRAWPSSWRWTSRLGPRRRCGQESRLKLAGKKRNRPGRVT